MRDVSREEKKYILTVPGALSLRHALSQVLHLDPHNGPEGYIVRSVYFDTLYDTDFYHKENGEELRKKVRLRLYDPQSKFARLEIKQKQGPYQRKRTLHLDRETAMSLLAGRYDALLEVPDPFALECYGMLQTQCYRPKTTVEYRRFAFVAPGNEIRITFDSAVAASESDFSLFSPALNLSPVFDPFHVILEVKYNGFLLSYLKNLLQPVGRQELSVSKYCLARGTGCNYQYK